MPERSLLKLISRYPRTLANLQAAIRELPYVLILDNNDLSTPFRPVAMIEGGRIVWSGALISKWLRSLLPAAWTISLMWCPGIGELVTGQTTSGLKSIGPKTFLLT